MTNGGSDKSANNGKCALWPIVAKHERIVVVLGNGASISEMKAAGSGPCPPADYDFLHIAEKYQRAKYKAFAKKFDEVCGGAAPYPLGGQRMEQIFAITYFLKQQRRGRSAEARAAAELYELLVLLLRETLVSTTNLAEPAQHLALFRHLLSLEPKSLDIVSFNYDVLADRALLKLSRSQDLTWSSRDGYGFRPDGAGVPKVKSSCRLHKLHGSMNWYIPIEGTTKSTAFNPKAKIYVPAPAKGSRSAAWQNRQACKGRDRSTKVFPLMVPPVFEKGLHIHGTLNTIWKQASDALAHSDLVVVWGYSMPATDYHSEIVFAQAARTSKPRLIVVNPNRAALARITDVCGHRWSRWFFEMDHLLQILQDQKASDSVRLL